MSAKKPAASHGRIFALASAANAAADRYRQVVDRPSGLSDTIAAANRLLAATDELTSAIADDSAENVTTFDMKR